MYGKVKSLSLVNMILANEWDARAQEMKMKPECFFTIKNNGGYLQRTEDGLQVSHMRQAAPDCLFSFILTAKGFEIRQNEEAFMTEKKALEFNGSAQLDLTKVEGRCKDHWLLKQAQQCEDFGDFFMERAEEGD